jgi:hypothetical protein
MQIWTIGFISWKEVIKIKRNIDLLKIKNKIKINLKLKDGNKD